MISIKKLNNFLIHRIYPEPKCKHACEKKEKRSTADGQCEVIVCVPTPECNCPENKPDPCGPCEKMGKIKLSQHVSKAIE